MTRIRGLVGLAVAAAALVAVAPPVRAALVTEGCGDAAGCTLQELAQGGAVRVGDLRMTNWRIVSRKAVDPSELLVQSRPDYDDPALTELQLTPTRRGALGVGSWGGYQSSHITYEFQVQAQRHPISTVQSEIEHWKMSGYEWMSPRIELTTVVGTAIGSADVGSATDRRTLTWTEPNAAVLAATPPAADLWVRVALAFATDYGYAYAGEPVGEQLRPALETRFDLDETTIIPVPAALPLFATGLAALGVLRRRRRRDPAG